MISSPNVIKPGDPMSVYIGNLNTGDSLQVLVHGDIKVIAGEEFFFQISDFHTGVSCIDSDLTVNMYELVEKDDAMYDAILEIVHNKNKDEPFFGYGQVNDGECVINMESDVFPDGIYDISLNGTASRTQVPLDLTFTGVADKREVLNELTMRIYGISNGIFEINTKVNGELAESKSFTIQDQFIAY